MEIAQYMQTKGFRNGDDLSTFIDQGAEHNEYYWGRRFEKPISFLYSAKQAASEPTFLE